MNLLPRPGWTLKQTPWTLWIMAGGQNHANLSTELPDQIGPSACVYRWAEPLAELSTELSAIRTCVDGLCNFPVALASLSSLLRMGVIFSCRFGYEFAFLPRQSGRTVPRACNAY